jgi:hypothetical protein
VTTDRDRILSEFIDAWNAGLRPEVDAFLERAPDADRADLAQSISSFLAWAPTPDYTEASLEAIAAEPMVRESLAAARGPSGLWPALLPRLRERAALTTTELATAVVKALGLPAARERKTAEYLDRMERGDLEPTGVSRRLLSALAGVLGVGVGELEGAGDLGAWRAPPAPAMFRAEHRAAEEIRDDLEILADALAASPSDDDGWDEVDRLFRGGR